MKVYIVEFNEYVGNFDIEFAAYMTGSLDYASMRGHSERDDSILFWNKRFPETVEYDPIFRMEYYGEDQSYFVTKRNSIALLFSDKPSRYYLTLDDDVLTAMMERLSCFHKRHGVRTASWKNIPVPKIDLDIF